MQFNSFTFVFFFVGVYILYVSLGRWWKLQNLLLLGASFGFLGFGGLRWLFWLSLSILLSYLAGRLLGLWAKKSTENDWKRKLLLALSILANLALLGVFKYYNFFAGNLAGLLNAFHLSPTVPVLNLIAPLGISFWTLKAMSYLIDVYQKRQQPASSLVDYALYISFFPTLLAGPIDRARKLLPQIAAPRTLTAQQLQNGLHLMLVGYFKKLVIADNLALHVANPIFGNYVEYAGMDLLLAGLAFTFQLYADFSGYTDIARGAALLLGLETTLNFQLPYFSINPTDFWQRWHISLSEWLRDYIFFPTRRAILRWKTAPSIFGLLIPPLVTMTLSGLWHGASWNFVLWGIYHGFLIILYRLIEKNPIHQNPWKSGVAFPWVLVRMLLMFVLTLAGWIIFRSETPGQALYMLRNISFLPSTGSLNFFYDLVFYTAPLWVVEWVQYVRNGQIVLPRLPLAARLLLNGVLLAAIIVLNTRAASEFIYVQF